MLALALILSLTVGVQKSDPAWLVDWVAGKGAVTSSEAVREAEVEARNRANRAWRDGNPIHVSKLRASLEQTLTNTQLDEAARGRATRALGWLRQPDSVPPLIAALAAGPLRLREEAAGALRHFGSEDLSYPTVGRSGSVVTLPFEAVEDARATTALATATRDPEARVRRAAFKALMQHQGPEVVTATLEAARAGGDVPELVPLLVRVRPAQLETLLLDFTRSTDEAARAAGARGLGSARLQSGKTRLLELLDDPSAKVFAAAHSALRELAGFPTAEMPQDAVLDRGLLSAMWRARK